MGNRLLEIDKKGIINFRNGGLSDASKATYTTGIRQYYHYIRDHDLPEGIESVKTWLSTIDNPSTYNLRLQSIREYLLYRFRNVSPEKRLELSEALKTLRRKKPRTAKIKDSDYLTINQINQIADETTDIISCFIKSLFWTGCRVSELINIKLSDCVVNGYASIRVTGKGDRERVVFMPLDEYENIREVFKGKVHLFETESGKQYRREYVSHEITRQTEKLGYDISSHTLRHSRAMDLKDRGLSPDQVARVLGHASPVTTLSFYFHGMPDADALGIL